MIKRSVPSVQKVLVISLALAIATLRAGEVPLSIEYDVEGVAYSEQVPKPEDVLGHRLGTRHTRARQLVDYYRAVAEASDRVVVDRHGSTYEGRELVHAIVTSPANHARLEEIRQANLTLSDPSRSVSDGQISNMPGVIYLGYSVHGNEATGSEASLLTLYHLAAGQGTPVSEALDNLVIILDPCFNPDGRDRFVNWVNGNRGGVATVDSQDREHNEPWPNGRTNHYWFDLNRDWLLGQLKESQARLQLYHHWRPQVLTDHHEMGGDSTFFFMPGIPSRNNPYTPERTFDLTAEIARYHAERMQEYGGLFYSEESFDDFYYGKGSTYPDVNGAVGILFEQASSRALKRMTDLGVLTYAYGIRNHFAVSLSTIEASVDLRERLLKHHRDFYAQASEVAAASAVKAFVFSREGNRRTRAQALARLLRRHRIQVHELAEDVSQNGKSFRRGQAYIVPLDQPQARLIQALFETMTEFNDVLFYDVSTWTLPLAFDVDYVGLTSSPGGALGDEVQEVALDGGNLRGDSDYAYILEWGRYFAPRALYRLLDAGLYPRVAMEEFEARVGGSTRRFAPGSIVVPLKPRDARFRKGPSDVRELLETIAGEDHLVIHAADSGLTPSGPDLGGASIEPLEKPEVAIVSGSGTNAYQVGQAWHLLSERMRVPASLLDLENIGRADLSRYNTLVLVDGSYGRLDAERVKNWVRGGGTLIAIHDGARWALEKEIVDEKLHQPEREPEPVSYGQVSRKRGAQLIGGSIFEAELDTTHPVAFGFGETVALFRNHTNFFEVSQTPGANVAAYSEDPLLSGYISDENLAEIPGTAAIIARRQGGGRVVLFADDPNFRAFWYGSNGLFLNAVFFGRVF